MNQSQQLGALESLLESFLDRAVMQKENRLAVLEGLNSLDDLVRKSERGIDFSDEAGEWFATHNRWLTEQTLKPADIDKIDGLLGQLRNRLGKTDEISPAQNKIVAEINRWDQTLVKKQPKLILKRPPEHIEEPKPTEVTTTKSPDIDTISLFVSKLSKTTALFMDYCENKAHLLSVLDDLLKSASVQLNKDALLLSGFIIYYLKQNGYKVEPYVKKLKEAETSIAKRTLSANRR